MEVRVSGLRRAAKNIAHNYTEPQKKVREATSNDPWGPSSTLMSEISDLTYNIEAFAQIMEMLWKRLNDSGKNWRHVYKALVLIDYLVKTGSERVSQQCKENIFAIQTLKDFQYVEESKDQGMNVREKAKQLISLLSSEERLRVERERALRARERFAQQQSSFGSSSSPDTSPSSPIGHHGSSPSNQQIEQLRPHSQGEEELQLQLALAISKEEAEEEEKQRRRDELRLQMAMAQSEEEFKSAPAPVKEPESCLLDLLDVDLGGSSGASAAPWGDPWGSNTTTTTQWTNPPTTVTVMDPWSTKTTTSDPWAPKMDEFSGLRTTTVQPNYMGGSNILVNMNDLTPPTNPFGIPVATNPILPMATTTPIQPTPNPFLIHNQIQKPSINEIRQMQAQNFGGTQMNFGQPQPQPQSQSQNNPWLPVDK